MKQPFEPPWGNYLLKDLSETPMPESISWLPQTIAWKIVFFLVICWLVKQLIVYIKHYQANAYRREALAWLAKLPHFDEQHMQPEYRQLPALIKCAALQAFSRAEVNQVTQKDWDCWLDSQCKQSEFAHKCPQLLTHLSYQPHLTIDKQSMQTLVEQIKIWIRYHRGSND